MSAQIFLGASSWAEKSLVDSGRFYPEEATDTPARLAYYSERFNLAEVDSTYYALPSKRNTQSWADAVPDTFRFNVKAFGLFTKVAKLISRVSKAWQLPDTNLEPVEQSLVLCRILLSSAFLSLGCDCKDR